ncbi:glycosyltransferase [Anaerocolumna sp.]|jgi:glycosyltransferase involved in cell wall biosynthesis|uniref:glycosyltransferase n=1 Tax=Anaerocolumna sp. TaxID=2041569 RepID=UPI0028B23EB2|nr:glycosyltransferase [Anaerocolumna sp.]
MKRIIHIISGLNNGGAEMMLYKLLLNNDNYKYNCEVISMTDKGVLGRSIERLGVKVHCLNLKRGFPNFQALIQTVKIIKGADIVQSWMYHADLLAFLSTRIIKSTKLIWGIRRSSLNKEDIKKSTFLVAKINAKLSKYVDRVISCSEAGRINHIQFGYNSGNIITIPNGFELERFKKTNISKKELNKLFNSYISNDTKIIGMIARWNPIKNHELLFKALKELDDNMKYNYKLVLCGPDVDEKNHSLNVMLKKYDLQSKTVLLGRRDDIPLIMSAIDIFVSPSKSEGFSNVIGEAMACECICIVTDVGDSKYIIGDEGLVVLPGDLQLMCEALEKAITLPENERLALGRLARERVNNNFDIRKIVYEYFNVYESI